MELLIFILLLGVAGFLIYKGLGTKITITPRKQTDPVDKMEPKGEQKPTDHTRNPKV